MLNQSFNPISICTVRRAFILILKGKAEAITSDNNKKIKTFKDNYYFPLVIKLNIFVNIPFKSILLNRKNILKRDGFKCCYCGRGDLPLTIDHVIPKYQGGADTWENLVTACCKCNNKKGSRKPSEANMKLLSKPFKPNHLHFLRNSVSKIDESWKPFLFLS